MYQYELTSSLFPQSHMIDMFSLARPGISTIEATDHGKTERDSVGANHKTD